MVTSTNSNAKTGYLTQSINPGDYYPDPDITKAVLFSMTMNTAAIQQIPILSSSPYQYLAGMVGPTNPGYNAPPYIPSQNLDANNYK